MDRSTPSTARGWRATADRSSERPPAPAAPPRRAPSRLVPQGGTQPGEGVLRGTALSFVVDADEPETLPITLGPLEVVEQRPDEVAADVDALADRLVQCAQMPVEVVDAGGVVNPPVRTDLVVGG